MRGVKISAYWRKAPYVLVHYRTVLLAVVIATALASLAASSSPFVTTAAASEALKNKLVDLSPFATGLEVETGGFVYGAESASQLAAHASTRDAAAERLRARLGHLAAPVFTSESGGVTVAGRNGEGQVFLMARTGVLDHIKVLAQVPGPGIWISDITAHSAVVKPGDVVRLDGLQGYFSHARSPQVRVKGIYRALAHSPQTDYWSNWFQAIYPQCLDCGVPTPFAFVDQKTLFAILAGRNTQLDSTVEFPADSHGITLEDARSLNRKFSAVGAGLRTTALGRKLGCTPSIGRSACVATSSLSAAVILANRNASAVTPAVTLLSDLGTAIALAVAAAAGVFLVRRRRAEAALLYARGEHVVTFAARSAVEALVPSVLGGAAGFGIAYALTDTFAPSGSISSSTFASGIAHAAVAVALAVALLVLCAALSFVRLYDTGSRRVPWLRYVIWEVVLIAISVFLYLKIRSGGGVTHGASAARVPTLAVFVFPLVLVAALAGLATRAARLGLRLGSRRTANSNHPAVYLALRRLGAARGLVVVLAVVTSASLGAFFYVETLATSLHHSTVEKAYMATGSDADVIVQDSQQLPKDFPYPITRVQFANQAASLADGTQVDVMLVDPATMPATLHWPSDWGPNPTRFLQQLGSSPSKPMPAIVTSDLAHVHSIYIQGEPVRLQTLATVHSFPFMAQGIPLVITSYKALNDFEARTKLYDSLGVLSTYVWGKGPPLQVAKAMDTLVPTYPPDTVDEFLKSPDVVLATRTFGFMRLIAVGGGVLALLGLVLYLQARQRSQAIAAELARRMGFSALAGTFSLCLELAGVLCFAGVVGGGVALASAAPIVHRIDPLPSDPPSPIFTIPTGEIAIAAVALLAFAVLAGAVTSWLSSRTDVAEALRVA